MRKKFCFYVGVQLRHVMVPTVEVMVVEDRVSRIQGDALLVTAFGRQMSFGAKS